jgi:allantoin racemase
MKIRIIGPVVRTGPRREPLEEYLKRLHKLTGVCDDTELESVGIKRGPTSIESRYDAIMASPDILRLIKEAEAEGADAVVVSCMGDPGVMSGKELVNIPVLGPCETSMLVASTLGDKTSIVTVLQNEVSAIEENVRAYGLSHKLASARSVNIPVLELNKDIDKTLNALVAESKKAVKEDGAKSIILGCTGMTGLGAKLAEKMDVPVLDPLLVTVKFAEMLVRLGLKQSKLAFPTPPPKKFIGYE